MRTTRLIPAAAIGAALVLLAGCSAASPEEQAVAEFKRLVEASANGGDLNPCEGKERDELTPAELPDGADIEVTDFSDGINFSGSYDPEYEGRFDVSADIEMIDSGEMANAAVWVRVLDGEDPCVHSVYGWR